MIASLNDQRQPSTLSTEALEAHEALKEFPVIGFGVIFSGPARPQSHRLFFGQDNELGSSLSLPSRF